MLSVLRDRIPHYGGKANFINPFLQINFTDWSFHMHTGYTLIQPYVFLTLNSLLTNEHLLSSPADLFCYEFSGDVSLKFVASPYTELIIGQHPDAAAAFFVSAPLMNR